MATITQTFQSTHLTCSGSRPRRRYCKQPLHWFELQADNNQTVSLYSDPAVIPYLPPGTTILQVDLAEDGLPTVSRVPGFTSGTSKASSVTYQFLDTFGALGNWLAEKSDAGISIVNGIIRQYTFCEGDSLATAEDRYAALRYTFQIDDHGNDDTNVYWIKGADIQRGLDVPIFEEHSVRMYTGIGDAEGGIMTTTIDVDTRPADVSVADYLTSILRPFQHSSTYVQDPDELISYWLIEGNGVYEYFSATGLRVGELTYGSRSIVTFVVKDRGLFGTIPQSWDVPESTALANRQKITWVPYFEEDPLSLAVGIATGTLLDGRVMPEGTHAKVEAQWINECTFESKSKKRRIVRQPKKTKAKEFIEKELMLFAPGVMTPGNDGRLEFLPKNTYGDTGAVATLTANDIDLSLPLTLEHDTSDLADVMELAWDYNPLTDKFQQYSVWDDRIAARRNKTNGKKKTYQSTTISTAESTEPEINRFAGIMHERHANPIPRIRRVRPSPDFWHLREGEIIQLDDWPVQDYTNGTSVATRLSRDMTIVSVTDNQSDNVVEWALEGSITRSEELLQTGGPQMTLAEHQRDALPLPGVVDGVLDGTGTYHLGTKYWHDGLLTIAATFNPNWAGLGGDFYISNNGILLIAATLDGTGEGRRTGGVGEAVFDAEAATDGERGLFGGPAGGSFVAYDTLAVDGRFIRRRLLDSVPPRKPPAHRPLQVSLSMNSGRLEGVPLDISGSGGHGSASSLIIRTSPGGATSNIVVSGKAGAEGGAGFKFVSHPGSGFIGSGKCITSGADTEDVEPYIYTPDAGLAYPPGLMPALPGKAQRGALLWMIDGAGTLPLISSANLIAKNGKTPTNPSDVETVLTSSARNVSAPLLSYYTQNRAFDDFNFWASSYLVTRIPNDAALQDSSYVSGVFGSLAISRQQTGRIVLRTTTSATVPPSDGLPGDLGIWDVALANVSNLTPPAWIMDDNFVWRVVDWSKVAPDYSTLLYVNRTFGGTESVMSYTRPVGKPVGTHWLNQSDGTEWILGATVAEDQPFRDQGVPVGIELLKNGNFGEGDREFVFTRQADLAPVNILSQIVDQIEQIFITQGLVEGEFAAYESGNVDDDVAPPPSSISVVGISDTSLTVSWTQPSDTSVIAGQEIFLDTVLAATVGASGAGSYLVEGLTAGGTYVIAIRNIGTNSTRSATISVTATTTDPGTPSPQTGIVLTHTGQAQVDGTRKVAGTAYQNNASIVIASGRSIQLTLNNGSVIGPETVGSGGAFTFNVASSHDAQLGKSATIYANNSDDTTKSTITFTYQL